MVNVNETHILIIGGAMRIGSRNVTALQFDNTWYFNHVTQEFIDGPNLRISRADHAAGVFVDSVSKEILVVVAGGINKHKILDSTEILKGDRWELGMYHVTWSVNNVAVAGDLTQWCRKVKNIEGASSNRWV